MINKDTWTHFCLQFDASTNTPTTVLPPVFIANALEYIHQVGKTIKPEDQKVIFIKLINYVKTYRLHIFKAPIFALTMYNKIVELIDSQKKDPIWTAKIKSIQSEIFSGFFTYISVNILSAPLFKRTNQDGVILFLK